MNTKKTAAVLAFSLLLAIGSGAQGGIPTFNLGDLTITPTRIVILGSSRTADVSLVNNSGNPVTYAISFKNYRMTEQGNLQELAEPGPADQFADGFIRFTPKRVVLEPGKVQTVRLQVLKPAGLADGEYRSHMVFQVVPDTAADTDSQQHEETNAIGVSLKPIFGISIPVIVRIGQTSAAVAVKDLALERGSQGTGTNLGFWLERSGNQSVYGNLEVDYLQPGRAPLSVGKLNGIAVYVPLAGRKVSIPLAFPDGFVAKGGTFRVRYLDPTKPKGKDVMATATLSGTP